MTSGRLPSFSHSRRTALRRCPRYFALTYLQGLDPLVKPEPLRMGTVFGQAMEHWDAELPKRVYLEKLVSSEISEVQHTKEESIVSGAAKIAISRLSRPEITEYEFGPWDIGDTGFQDNGRFDGFDIETRTITEYKLKARPMNRYELARDPQVTAYISAASRILDVPAEQVNMRYVVMLKPALTWRQVRQPEALHEYGARLRAAMKKDPDKYISESWPTRTQQEVDEFNEELRQQAVILRSRLDADAWPRDADRCNDYGGCSMRRICWPSSQDDYERALAFFKQKQTDLMGES